MLVQPRLLARTVSLPRTVVRIVEVGAEVVADEAEAQGDDGDDGAVLTIKSDPDAVAADKAFWERFAQAIRLDDPSQPPPRRRGFGHARFDFETPYVWVTAYRARSVQTIGVYAAFRGDLGRAIYDRLAREEAEALNAELSAATGRPVEWRTERNPVSVLVRISDSFEPAEEADVRHLTWLAKASNAFVNAFRPRLHRLLAEGVS